MSETQQPRVRKLLVAGRVQGVSFRWFTTLKARELGCRGSVRNLADGRVEVLLVDEDPEASRALREHLAKGPSVARVDSVEEEKPSPEEAKVAAGRRDFEIVY